MSETEDKIKEVFSKSAKATKSVFEKASSAVQAFSDKSVTKIERTQLKNNREKKYAEIGLKISTLLSKKNSDIAALGNLKDAESTKLIKEITALQNEVVKITKQISEKDKELKTTKTKK